MAQRTDRTGQLKKVHLGAWRRQDPDDRDRAYSLKYNTVFQSRPSKVDLRPICSDIEDQGELGSCTAQSIAALIEANQIRAGASKGNEIKLQSQSPTIKVLNPKVEGSTITLTLEISNPQLQETPVESKQLIQISRLFHYYITRMLEGTVEYDSGATLRNTIKAGVQYGMTDESLWGYNPSRFTQEPPTICFDQAALHKVSSYHSIQDGDLETMKVMLSQQYLIAFGIQCYDSLLSQETATSGKLCYPKPTEKPQGGRAIALCGYDDEFQMPDGSIGAFLVRNSWGTNWGIEGYFWISYQYIQDTHLAQDFWVVQSSF